VERETGLEPATFCLEDRFTGFQSIPVYSGPVPIQPQKRYRSGPISGRIAASSPVYSRPVLFGPYPFGTHLVPIPPSEVPHHGD
jgi:hypothetical protein